MSPDREADLIPLATLAGSFDSSSEIDVTARLWVGGVGSAIRNDPPVNAIVIAVIRQDYLGYQISPEICLFMPEQKGLVVIEGFGDPKVLQTIEKIRAVRHKGHPATRPATQPVAVPATRVSE